MRRLKSPARARKLTQQPAVAVAEKAEPDRVQQLAKTIDSVSAELKRLSDDTKANSDKIAQTAALRSDLQDSKSSSDKTAQSMVEQIDALRSDQVKFLQDAKESNDKAAQALRQEFAASQAKLVAQVDDTLKANTARSEALAQRVDAMKKGHRRRQEEHRRGSAERIQHIARPCACRCAGRARTGPLCGTSVDREPARGRQEAGRSRSCRRGAVPSRQDGRNRAAAGPVRCGRAAAARLSASTRRRRWARKPALTMTLTHMKKPRLIRKRFEVFAARKTCDTSARPRPPTRSVFPPRETARSSWRMLGSLSEFASACLALPRVRASLIWHPGKALIRFVPLPQDGSGDTGRTHGRGWLPILGPSDVVEPGKWFGQKILESKMENGFRENGAHPVELCGDSNTRGICPACARRSPSY